MAKKLLDVIPLIYGAAIGTAATLTDTASDNEGICNIKNVEKPNLLIEYVPKSGQTDRYLTISVLFSNKDSLPAASEFTAEYGSLNVTTGELDIYNNAFNFPGSKTSTGGTTYGVQISLPDVAARWMLVTVKESGSADFGTVLINACGYEDY